VEGKQLLYYYFYSDGIFSILQCITRQHRAPIRGQLTTLQIAKDTAMSRLKTSAEWPYETETNLFHILHSKYNETYCTIIEL